MEAVIGCSIIFHDNEQRVLIAQRSKSKKTFPLMWETIGGTLENNETPEECIKREVKEEIGCGISDLKLFKVYFVKEEERQHVLIVFTGKIQEEVKLNDEIENVQWIRQTELHNFDFCFNCKEKLIDFYNEWNGPKNQFFGVLGR